MLESGCGGEGANMLKIVIFDSGYGGEDFADRLESELPTTEIIRVIDRKSTDQVLKSTKNARALAEKALLPFIGKVVPFHIYVIVCQLKGIHDVNFIRAVKYGSGNLPAQCLRGKA